MRCDSCKEEIPVFRDERGQPLPVYPIGRETPVYRVEIYECTVDRPDVGPHIDTLLLCAFCWGRFYGIIVDSRREGQATTRSSEQPVSPVNESC